MIYIMTETRARIVGIASNNFPHDDSCRESTGWSPPTRAAIEEGNPNFLPESSFLRFFYSLLERALRTTTNSTSKGHLGLYPGVISIFIGSGGDWRRVSGWGEGSAKRGTCLGFTFGFFPVFTFFFSLLILMAPP